MTLTEHLRGKQRAARTLYRMWRHLKNWRQVWSSYRNGKQLPPLAFRRGFTLRHGQWDSPISLLHDVFADRLYSRLLPDDTEGIVVDIGANIGAAVLDLARQHPRLVFHAYEPNPESCRTLAENLDANGLSGRVQIYNEAVAGECGSFDLWVDVTSVGCTGYSDHAPTGSARKITVPAVNLRKVTQRLQGQSIVLLKIDAEGAEGDILEGAYGGAPMTIRQVAVEYHETLLPGVGTRCKAALDRLGFECSILPNNDHPGVGMIYGSQRHSA